MLSAASFAQQQLATLNHNDTISVYYGETALREAHAAAATGDIITLSPGRFSAITITKAITIRGAGMMRDSLGNEPTYVYNSTTYLDVPTDSTHYLTLEGINFSTNVSYKQIYAARFIKCSFSYFLPYDGSTSKMSDSQFVNCIVSSINSFSYSENDPANTQFINSIILSISVPRATLLNCVAKISMTAYSLSRKTIQNSILIGTYDEDGPYSTAYSFNGSTCFNSIGVYPYGRGFDTVNTPDHDLHSYGQYSDVFKTFNGTYTEGETFELKDAIATGIRGDDGTQVGIYGGSFPFDANVRNPRIRRCTVARRATADSKLSVNIEVVSE